MVNRGEGAGGGGERVRVNTFSVFFFLCVCVIFTRRLLPFIVRIIFAINVQQKTDSSSDIMRVIPKTLQSLAFLRSTSIFYNLSGSFPYILQL